MTNELTEANKTNLGLETAVKFNKLKPRAKRFITYICEGRKTIDAYNRAGYTGNRQSAYQLRCEYGWAIDYVMQNEGLDRLGLLTEIKKLMELPLAEHIKALSVKEKLSVLRELGKLLPQQKENKQISTFLIQKFENVEPPKQVIDTTAQRTDESI
jgi:predicted glycosyltransferase